jgi:hypothetical protein
VRGGRTLRARGQTDGGQGNGCNPNDARNENARAWEAARCGRRSISTSGACRLLAFFLRHRARGSETIVQSQCCSFAATSGNATKVPPAPCSAAHCHPSDGSLRNGFHSDGSLRNGFHTDRCATDFTRRGFGPESRPAHLCGSPCLHVKLRRTERCRQRQIPRQPSDAKVWDAR